MIFKKSCQEANASSQSPIEDYLLKSRLRMLNHTLTSFFINDQQILAKLTELKVLNFFDLVELAQLPNSIIAKRFGLGRETMIKLRAVLASVNLHQSNRGGKANVSGGRDRGKNHR